jgi:hypothetical protein
MPYKKRNGRELKIETRDLAALILALGVACAVIALAIGAAVHSTSISISEATLLGTVLGTAVGGLATFLGFRAREGSTNNSNQAWPPAPTSHTGPPTRPS